MEYCIQDLIADVGSELIENTDQYRKLERILGTVQKIQKNAEALLNNDDPAVFNTVRMGTVLVLSVLGKHDSDNPKELKDFTKDDWKEIADNISGYVILSEGSDYSRLIFGQYAVYLDKAAEIIGLEYGETEKEEAIHILTDELRANENDFNDGIISETAYIDGNLWICLESVMKLLSAYLSYTLIKYAKSEEFAILSDAVLEFSYEYFRYRLYRREQLLLNEYIENQKVLDAELESKFRAYVDDLNQMSAQFNDLIKQAFDPDFRVALVQSAALAHEAGVPYKEILRTLGDIDDFFM